MEQTHNNLRDSVKHFVIKWNTDFPIDRWWRTKHNIPFGSEAHKKADFIQMFLEYEEDLMIKKLSKEKSSTEEASDFFSTAGKEMSQEEIDKEFDNLDFENLDIK